jgi:hypothetical protein
MKLYKDRYFLALAIVAGVISFILYYISKAPTVSFWDCGEFISTSYILGIPHPPGNPLFVLIGRLFTLLPIARTIAVRVNLISVVSSAGSVFMAFWIILRLSLGSRIEMPRGNTKIALGVGALAGSLIMGFSNTVWSSAVEAEVYGLAMFLMLIITYIALLWAENSVYGNNDKYLIAISYLLWLSLGIHMTTFIITLPVVLFLAYVDYKKNQLEHWPIWVIMLLFLLYAAPAQTPLLSIIGINASAYELDIFFILISLAFVGSVVMAYISRKNLLASARIWSLTVLIMIAGLVGYSTQAYIPIRAANKPAINENDPSNWDRFNDFLERKQYGQESMITRMFHRRASWTNQFISHPDFGLLRILTEQFSSPDARLPIYENKQAGLSFGLNLWLLYVVILGIGGIMEAIKRSPPEGLFIVFAMLLCTVGLVFYLNFSDGSYNTTIAPLAEVRNRDYFYTPGFIFYAILIGIGLSAFLEWIAQTVDTATQKAQKWLRPLLAITLIGALVLSYATASAGLNRNDRRGNYIPWDYANNILQSCEKNAILFTNGDNDTFPLWFIQEVDGVRKDVRVANLSLLNTPWYIHQLKDQYGVPINLSYDEIENLRAMRMQGGGVWRIQDEMVKQLITASQADNWNPPIYFAMTVASENRLGLEDHLILEGMAYKVVESTGKDRINPSIGQRIFINPANFRGIADPNVRKDDNDQRLVSNYISAMFQVVETYEQQGKYDSAMVMAEAAVGLHPQNSMWQARAYLIKLYANKGLFDRIDPVLATTDSAFGEKILLAVSQDLLLSKNFDAAAIVLSKTIARSPASFPALNNLVVAYYQKGDSAAARSTIDKFKALNSGDASLMKTVNELEGRMAKMPKAQPEAK